MFGPYRICVALGLDKPDLTADPYPSINATITGVSPVSGHFDRAPLKTLQQQFFESQGIHSAQPGKSHHRRLRTIAALQLAAHGPCLPTPPSMCQRSAGTTKEPGKEHNRDNDKP
ncbi:hypothetical protein RLDS_09575 [Sphingobium lactosutens DS20]|jgi:hypothetical protein|uniref:Uncharacterized protein n=1 Tax=Sphingobium lactosutens DS20 TaxID=1331060 RepID=T0HI10_9SPHN|nr:hypothetical protein RLDS_09575 [Sphingobium lactosutens DS20]